jgi:hypothetical protein
MPEKVLDFEAERDAGTDSWQRASREALIERTAWNKWRVTLPDGEDAHEVRLERDHGALVGECIVLDEADEPELCPGFRWHEGPCAHLCTVRKAAFVRLDDARGEPVVIVDREDVDAARADHAVEKIVADGGRG